jgi:mannose-6-phosphate isomerase class I
VHVGPENVPSECELALALSLLGSKPGSTSQRFAMLSAVRRAWPDDPVGVLGCMMLEDVVLAPGEAVMIPAGCPHAYGCGGCASC